MPKQKLNLPENQEASVEEIICEVCFKHGNSKVAAIGYCRDCVSYFCTPCLKVHEVILPKHHQLLGEDVPKHFSHEKCSVHPDEFVKFFCEMENKFECKICHDMKQCSCCRILPDFVRNMTEKDEINHFVNDTVLCLKSIKQLDESVNSNKDLYDICTNNSKNGGTCSLESLRDIPRKSGRSMYMVEILDRDQMENDITEICNAKEGLVKISSDVLDRIKDLSLCQCLMEIEKKKPLLNQIKNSMFEIHEELEITSYKVDNGDLINKSKTSTSCFLDSGKQIFQKFIKNVGHEFIRFQRNNISLKFAILLVVSIVLSTCLLTSKIEPEQSNLIEPNRFVSAKAESDQYVPKFTTTCFLSELNMIILFDERNSNIKLLNSYYLKAVYQLEPYNVLRADLKCSLGKDDTILVNLVMALNTEVLAQVLVVEAKEMQSIFQANVDMSCKDVTWLDPGQMKFLCLFQNQTIATVELKEQVVKSRIRLKEKEDTDITEIAYSMTTDFLYFTVTGPENKVCQRKLASDESVCLSSHHLLRGPFNNLLSNDHGQVIVSNRSSNDMMVIERDMSSVKIFHIQNENSIICIAVSEPNSLYIREYMFVDGHTGDIYWGYHLSSEYFYMLRVKLFVCLVVIISFCSCLIC
ncbi:uncharacterized protein LOC128239864 [Mya arenaria]|uniref:uncharacterized protein LOC128239864 n=1 Tax=Mya arenaria TaxID=6604 RepID=UPI0022DFAEDA|nr:uncharacterized protein LOC128239864 [Mya arenaria]XP_052812273.1 uncharacterized protein LOC128239864 [Mya arenaria]